MEIIETPLQNNQKYQLPKTNTISTRFILYWPTKLKYKITFDPDSDLMSVMFEDLLKLSDEYVSTFNVPEWSQSLITKIDHIKGNM